MSYPANLLKCAIICILIFGTIVVWAKNICSHCQFENEEGDRYCLNCSKEIREITIEEKEKLESFNKKNEARQLERPFFESKIDNSGHEKKQPIENRPSTLNMPGEKAISLGSSKIKIFHLLGELKGYAKVKEAKSWKLDLREGSGYVIMDFDDDDNLSGWKLELRRATKPMEGEVKNSDISIGMTESQVIKKWGKPYRSVEENHENEYILEYEYLAQDRKGFTHTYRVRFGPDKKVSSDQGS